MRSRVTVFILVAVALVFGLLFARQRWIARNFPHDPVKKLRVLTYSSFNSPDGPGKEIVKRFQRENACDVEVLTVGDAGLLLERLKLKNDFDVVVGLDQLMLEHAKQLQWKPVTVPTGGWNSSALAYGVTPFMPFDWSLLTFIYRNGEIDPPRGFDDLLAPRFRNSFALQDPHASTPGMQFFQWIAEVKGPNSGDFLAALKPNVQSVSPSWSFAYGLFKKKQAKLVFSYITSLAYHWGNENDRSYQAVSLAEGHPAQIEFAAIPATCSECDLAGKFLLAMSQPWAQKLIMEKNFMFPVVKSVETGTIFSQLPPLKVRSIVKSRDLGDWNKIFRN